MKRELITLHSDSRFLSVSEQQKSYDEIVDLFARGASSAEVLAFRPSQETRDRVRFLLERNATEELTEEEAMELERYGELEHLMQLVKVRAQEYLKLKHDSRPYLRSLTARGAGTSERALRVLFTD